MAEEGVAKFTRLRLHTIVSTNRFAAANGGTYVLSGEATLAFAPNSFTLGGALYQGDVLIRSVKVDKSDDWLDQLVTGDNRGLDTLNKWKALTTYGQVVIEATGTNGEPLQFNAEATLTIPMIGGTTPDTTLLWHFNDTLGVWKQSGVAVKSGAMYVTKIKKLGTLNFATAANAVTVSGRLLTVDGEPVPFAYLAVSNPSVTAPTRPLWQYSDGEGKFAIAVPADQLLSLDVSGNECNSPGFSKSFSTGKENLALGDISLPADRTVRITSTLRACNGTPVSNGILHMYFGKGNVPIYAGNNGQVQFNTIVCSFTPYTTAMFLANEPSTGQISDPVYRTFTPGVNDLGDVSVCGTAESVPLEATFLDNNGAPLPDLLVQIEAKRTPGEFFTVRTDPAGKLSANVYQNSEFSLRVYGSADCATPAYTTTFQTTNQKLSLGTRTVTDLVKATLTGRLVACNNSPVSSGQVILQRDGQSRHIKTDQSGSFSFPVLVCNSNSPQTVSIIGLDQNNLQTGLPVTLSIRSGTIDAGAVSTCFDNASAQEYLNCTVGNDVFSFQSTLDSFAHTIQNGTGWHVFLAGNRNSVFPGIHFSCYRNAALGTQNPGLDEFGIPPYYDRYAETHPDSVAVTYTEFGPVGGFIAGHFTLKVKAQSGSGSVHDARVKFRIRRRY